MWKALEVLSYFDWFGPWLRFLQTIGRKTRTFFVPFDGRWSGQSLHDLLEEYGVEMMAWEVCNGEQFFHVDADQADWTYQVLIRHGVELL
jgi:hypothetical protein